MPKQHRPKHPHHRWITNSEAVVSVREAGRLMGLLAERLETTGNARLNNIPLDPPENCRFVMRYEHKPHGELCVKVELVWFPENGGAGVSQSSFDISSAE